MQPVSITEQTRAQVERAERAAEEARNRNRAARPAGLKLVEEGEPRPPELDEGRALDHAAD